MKVHEAAKQLGVTPRTLRFYEEKGLIKPQKESDNGYRSYTEEDLVRLRWIVSLRELGMTVSSILETLRVMDEPEAFIRSIDAARAVLYEEWITATQALHALDDTISEWQREGSAKLHQAEQHAERMKQNRLLRSTWSDQWNYDEMALRFGYDAPLVTLEGKLSSEEYEYALHRTVEWLDPRPNEHGLELGAGSGNLSVRLHAAGVKLTVIEQSAEMLSILRDRIPSADAKQGNLLALPLTAQSYAFIGCTFALHHLNHSQQLLALEEMDRVLLADGRIVITGLMKANQTAIHEHRLIRERSNLTYSSLSKLVDWFKNSDYSVVTEKLNSQTHLLFAAKRPVG